MEKIPGFFSFLPPSFLSRLVVLALVAAAAGSTLGGMGAHARHNEPAPISDPRPLTLWRVDLVDRQPWRCEAGQPVMQKRWRHAPAPAASTHTASTSTAWTSRWNALARCQGVAQQRDAPRDSTMFTNGCKSTARGCQPSSPTDSQPSRSARRLTSRLELEVPNEMCFCRATRVVVVIGRGPRLRRQHVESSCYSDWAPFLNHDRPAGALGLGARDGGQRGRPDQSQERAHLRRKQGRGAEHD